MATDAIACFFCGRKVAGHVEGLGRHVSWHVRNNDFSPDSIYYDCTLPGCSMRYHHFSSLKRHISEKHPFAVPPIDKVVSNNIFTENFCDVSECITQEISTDDESTALENDALKIDEIKQIISLSICRLVADSGLPRCKIMETVNICENVVNHVTTYLEKCTISFLQSNGVDLSNQTAMNFINKFRALDLFGNVKSKISQQQFLKSLAGSMPQPREKCVGSRTVVRHSNGISKAVKVNDTFVYIPIKETLQLIFRNSKTRDLLRDDDSHRTTYLKEYSSFKSGETYISNTFLNNYPDAVRISIYQDEIELGNALSSRAGKNKISNFCFKIQNFPEKWNSSPKAIFPLIYALASTTKKIGLNRIMKPLIEDLKELEQGVEIYYGSEKFHLRVILTMFCGDTLAAHDVFGLLGPGATYFCRLCTIDRPSFRNTPTAKFPNRTIEWYDTNISAVRNGLIKSNECGLKETGSVLNDLDGFHITSNWSLDVMHDLGEGIIPLTLQLVLSHYAKQKAYGLTKEYINHRISTFNYGYLDRKNRPSPNITNDMLSRPTRHKMKQTAAQYFLFLRAFPFLFGHKVPADCELMQMIGHLINISRILLSPNVSEDMLIWLEEHIRIYNDIFYKNFDKRINKSHHLLHYPECIRKSGSMKQYNCLTFEQKNKPLKGQAATCRNFKNICKSIRERQCFRMVIDVLDNPFRDKLVFQSGPILRREDTQSGIFLAEHVTVLNCPKSINFNGIDFRNNLVVALKMHDNMFFPSYGIIKEIVEFDNTICFLLQTCNTVCYDDFLQAYEVQLLLESRKLVNIEEIHQHTTFSLWTAEYSDKKFISRRLFNQDY